MGLCLHVVGFRPADDTWHAMKQIWVNCATMGIEPPQEVLSYFDGEPPGDKPGMEVDLQDALAEYQGEYSEGYTIDISKLPKDIRFIRAYNSC